MKAAVYVSPESMEIRDIPIPEVHSNLVKIKIKACGICGSDVHGYAGLTGRRTAPMIMGHEFSGEVVETGPDANKFVVGDRVVPYPVEICGDCKNCLAGNTHICMNKKAYGVLDCDGALTEYIAVPEQLLFKIDDHVSYSTGAMIEPMAVALRGVNHAGDIAGRSILIVGAGTIGLMTLALIKMKNPAQVIISDKSKNRLKVALAMGADHVLDPSEVVVEDKILELTDGVGVDLAIECVGITPTVKQTIDCLKMGGAAVWVGNSAKNVEVDMQRIVTRELSVAGSFLYTLKEFEEAISILNSAKICIDPIISKEIRLADAPAMFNKLYKDPGDLIKVVVVQ